MAPVFIRRANVQPTPQRGRLAGAHTRLMNMHIWFPSQVVTTTQWVRA
jgi:hypothetical protein